LQEYNSFHKINLMKKTENYIIPTGLKPSKAVLQKCEEFIGVFKCYEILNAAPLILFNDKKCDAFYLNCHLSAKDIAGAADIDAVLDPAESEDYKLNREIYTDTYAYKMMLKDAENGRSFEDLVVEYDTSYKKERPLKVFGGQHRIQAIHESLKKTGGSIHGLRVYFALDVNQRVNIAIANNTSVTVANDLLDRIQEEHLGPDLRNWCQKIGLLKTGENFSDKRNPQGIPTIRIARTLIVNYYLGKEANIEDLNIPIVCNSGPGVDEKYESIRQSINWNDTELLKIGKVFASLHNLQRERVLKRDKDNYLEFANKTIHPCVVASWSFAAGLFSKDQQSLDNHFSLIKTKEPDDPLNAKALQKAKFKGIDSDSYRGLGSRINANELGRMLQVFILQATKAKERGINEKLANAAIQTYEAKKAQKQADQAVEKI